MLRHFHRFYTWNAMRLFNWQYSLFVSAMPPDKVVFFICLLEQVRSVILNFLFDCEWHILSGAVVLPIYNFTFLPVLIDGVQCVFAVWSCFRYKIRFCVLGSVFLLIKSNLSYKSDRYFPFFFLYIVSVSLKH